MNARPTRGLSNSFDRRQCAENNDGSAMLSRTPMRVRAALLMTLLFLYSSVPLGAAVEQGTVVRDPAPSQNTATPQAPQTATPETGTAQALALPQPPPAPAASDEDKPPSFDQRFTLPALEASSQFPILEAKDCGCVPDESFLGYGFQPLAGQDKPAQINLGVLSRVAYFGLSPDSVGNIELPPDWDAKAYSNVVHRYASAVDVVISQDQWCSESDKTQCVGDALELDKSYVLQNLIDEIVDTVAAVDADGVTIDFKRIPASIHDGYRFFIKRLGKRLEQEGDYYLNVVLPNPTELKRLFADKDALAGLLDSKDYVDLFLIGWSGQGDLAKTINELDNAFWSSDIEARKVVIVLNAADENFERKYQLALKRNFGGVGIWPVSEEGTWEAVVAAGFTAQLQAKEMDLIKRLTLSVMPEGFCKFICPNRDLIGDILITVVGLYVLLLLLSVLFYELRRYLHRYALYVLAFGVLIVLVFFSLVMCVPFWRGYQTEITAALLFLGLAYLIKSYMDKKREAHYP